MAGEPQFSARLRTELTLTDNARLSASNEEIDLILRLSPSIQASGRGGRMTWNIGYAPSLVFYAANEDRNSAQSNLNAFATLEAVDNWLPLVKQSSQSVPIHVPEPIAARMFVPNIDVCRSQPYIQKNYRDAELLQLRSKILGLISDGDHRRVVTFWRRRIVWVRQAI